MNDARRPLHTRTIRLDGFERPDGMFDVEARLTDVKHYDLPAADERAPLPAGVPMHDLLAAMTVDAQGTIHAFGARTEAGPHPSCAGGSANFSRLVGLSIGKGFLKQAGERVGGTEGCTHLRELLQQMATVAFQSMREARIARYAAAPQQRPPLIDSCFAWAASGDWVRVRFPAFHTGTADPGGDAGRGGGEGPGGPSGEDAGHRAGMR
jgi:hypothetical protein